MPVCVWRKMNHISCMFGMCCPTVFFPLFLSSSSSHSSLFVCFASNGSEHCTRHNFFSQFNVWVCCLHSCTNTSTQKFFTYSKASTNEMPPFPSNICFNIYIFIYITFEFGAPWKTKSKSFGLWVGLYYIIIIIIRQIFRFYAIWYLILFHFATFSTTREKRKYLRWIWFAPKKSTGF